jgi:TetR/AcrR family transcriptional regulator, transcriptional repressor for nem operon
MARPREFDPDLVLEQVMLVFWARGYQATSLDDLCEATQLNRSSLYAAFGDKREMFLQTIDRYGDGAVARVSAALSRPVPIQEAMAGFFTHMIDQIAAGPGRIGCFIGNSAAEVARHDRGVAARVRRNLDRVERTFQAALEQAKARGEIPADADVQAMARFFVASAQGIRLIGKTTGDRGVLEDIMRIVLRTLDLPQ